MIPLYFQAIVDKLREDPQLIVGGIFAYITGYAIEIHHKNHWCAEIQTNKRRPHELIIFLNCENYTNKRIIDVSDPTSIDQLLNIIDESCNHQHTSKPSSINCEKTHKS